MIDKRKLIFWRVAATFGAVTILMLFSLWNSAGTSQSNSAMMSSSMGNMMKSNNLRNISIYDLFKGENMNEMMSQSQTMRHSENMDITKYKVGLYGTIIIFLLLPFIIGGTIILGIVWMK